MSDQTPDQEPEVSFYEKLANRTAELLESGRKTLDEALKKAKEELATAEDFSREQADKVASFVRRDLREQAESLKKVVNPQRMSAGIQSALARILAGAAQTLGEWAEKSEKQLEYHTGEVTSPGTLTCRGCEAEMHLTHTVRIPPCPKCHKTVFRKGY